MSIAFQAASAPNSGSPSSTMRITWPGSPSGQLLVAIFGFEGVNPGSGPWISGTPGFGGWSRAFFQEPNANGGCGLEVWTATNWQTGGFTDFQFFSSYNVVGTGIVYTGEAIDVGNAVRVGIGQAWTGNNPQSPSAVAFQGEMAIICAADTLNASGYTHPSGWSGNRFDNARGGTTGQVEITAADLLSVVDGNVVPTPWTATVSPGGAHGATGILLVRPPSIPVQAGSPYLAGFWPAT